MTYDAYDKYFAVRLRRRRQELSWTQAGLAQKANLSTHTIQMIEAGAQGTKLRTAALLAHVIGASLDDLLAAPSCSACLDAPPEGFICSACSASGQVSEA